MFSSNKNKKTLSFEYYMRGERETSEEEHSDEEEGSRSSQDSELSLKSFCSSLKRRRWVMLLYPDEEGIGAGGPLDKL